MVVGVGVELAGAGVEVAGAGVDVTGAGVDVTGAGVEVTGAGVDVTGAGVDVTGVGEVLVGVGDGEVLVGVGDGEDFLGVGAGEEVPGFGVGVCDPEVVVVGTITGSVHDTVYVAGFDVAATGLVTTRTAEPEPGWSGGVIVAGLTLWVPALVKFKVCGAVVVPSDIAQW